MAQRHKSEGLVVLGVNAWNEDAATLRKYVRDQGLHHRILLDGADVAKRYPGTGVPTVFWIDRDGRFRAVAFGYHGPATLERNTARLIADKL